MIEPSLLEQIKEYMKRLEKKVTIRLHESEHEKRTELLEMLEGIVSTSELLSLEIANLNYRSGVSFDLLTEEKETGISFSGIPGGHEFSSLILALLQSGGVPLKLDESLQSIIKGFSRKMNFETIVSLECHNCPEVVQALNQMSLLNPSISHEMIDGGLFPELIKERKVQGVPTIYLDGKIFGNGKIEISDILDKIRELSPDEISTPASDVISDEIHDVTIIGGGPAGVSAAIYSARKGLNVLVIADRIGGQVKDTMDIENMISVIRTTGPNLVNSMEEHLNYYNVKTRKNLKVKSIENGSIKKVELNTGDIIRTKTIILATGAKWRELGVPGEKENIGSGVAYCPHCDGPFFKNKDVIVVGGGNSGIEAALDLSGIVKSVTVLEFMSTAKADKVLLDKAASTSNISIMTDIQSKEITTENGKVNGLKYINRKDNSENFIKTDGIFIQIGLIPNSSFAKGIVSLNKFGEVIVDDKCKTDVPGIFACGDVTTVPYKQIIISMGEGAKAALSAFEYILMHSEKEAA